MCTGKISRVLVCIMVLAPIFRLSGQTSAQGARSGSMAGVSAGLEDAWAVCNNPAGLARNSRFSIATSMVQRFLMKELGQYSIALSYPVEKGGLGISGTFSGYKSYIDQRIALAYGRLFGKNFLTGLSLVYVYQKAGENHHALHQVSYELGIIAVVSPKISLAFSAFNPFQLNLKSQDYASLPSIFRIGLTYRYLSSLAIYTELEKDLDLPPSIKIGMEYFLNEVFILRGGIKGFPVSYSFGTGIKHRQFLFEFASAYHQYLGFSPNISIQYDFQ